MLKRIDIAGIRSWNPLRFGFPCLPLVLMMAGCADPAAHWQRADTTDAQRQSDYRACKALASADAGGGVEQDISASRAAESHGPTGADEQDPGLASRTNNAVNQSVILCMTDHGYSGR